MSDDGHRRTDGTGPPVASASGRDQPAWVRAELLDIREPLAVDAAATAREAARLRHEFSTWLALDVPPDLLDDIVLAVYEAVANAAEHAYAGEADGAGAVRLTARRSDDCLLVVVSDDGRWLEPTSDALRRRGLPLMRGLLRDVHVSRGDAGTVVHLGIGLPPP